MIDALIVRAYDELQCYSLAHGAPSFIHQHVVDAWAAQLANAQTKPISLTFALVGLYLHVERGFSGRQVQQAHQQLARRKQPWPSFPLPSERGKTTVVDVIAAPAGLPRDRAIDQWCTSVWDAYRECHGAVAALVRQNGIL